MNKQQEFILKEYEKLERQRLKLMLDEAKRVKEEAAMKRFILDCPCGGASFASREEAENYFNEHEWPCGCKPEIREVIL